MRRIAQTLALGAALAALGAPAAHAALTFAPAVALPTGGQPSAVAVGDLNGDRVPDLAVANGFSGSVSVMLGTGSGGFTTTMDYPAGGGSSPNVAAVAIGDLDGDGIPDLATADYASASVSVLRGTGSGTFGAATTTPVGSHPNSVALGDFNRDGRLDLAAADSFDDSVSVLLGTGAGALAPALADPVGNLPNAVVAGDFDHDGNLDLATADAGSNTVSILTGDGTGTFAPAVAVPVGSGPNAIAVGDLNRDGNLDLVTANVTGGSVSVLLGTSSGTFAAATTVPTGTGSDGVALADFDRDGNPDLAVTGGDVSHRSVSVLPGDGTGALGTPAAFVVGNDPVAPAVGDFNRDGAPDLVAANVTDDTVGVLRNAPAVGLPAGPIAFGAAPQGLPTAAQTVTVTNTAVAPLRVAGLTIAGGQPDDFLITSNSCQGTIAAGGTCAVGVSFTPQALGGRAATLQVTSNAADASVVLTGVGDDTSVTGTPGPAGGIGPAGSMGAAGPAGAAGANGAAGAPGPDSTAPGAAGAAGSTGGTGATGPGGSPGAAGPRGATGARGKTGPAGRTVSVVCQVRRSNGHTRVKCGTTTAEARRATAWRLTHGARTVARGVALPRRGRIAVDLPALGARLRPGHYVLTIGTGPATVHRPVIVKAA